MYYYTNYNTAENRPDWLRTHHIQLPNMSIRIRYTDPQLKERNLFWRIDHPETGPVTHLGQSFMLSETPARAYRPSPLLGEHTEYVCSEILGMTDKEFIDLTQAGVFE